MERSIYCSLSELWTMYDSDRSGRKDDWRPKVIKELDTVFAFTEDEEYLQNNTLEDEKSFIAAFDGVTRPKDNIFAKKYELYDWLGGKGKLKFVKDIRSHFPDMFLNGAICKSVATDINAVKRFGIEAIDDSNDKWVASLREHWYEDTIQAKCFSWMQFFGQVPASNSVVMIDRYLFVKKQNGAFNVGSILNSIIPDDYDHQYNVTIVFELNSLEWRQEEKKKDKRRLLPNKLVKEDVEDISFISNSICQAIRKNKQVCLNFIAVLDPKEQKQYDKDTSYLRWKNLHNATHDRRIITNYFRVKASQAISATWEDSGKACYSQNITYESLLSEIDNPRQNFSFIPFISIRDYLKDLSKFLRNAPVWAYCCFHFDLENNHLMLCGLDSLRSPLLSVEKQGQNIQSAV